MATAWGRQGDRAEDAYRGMWENLHGGSDDFEDGNSGWDFNPLPQAANEAPAYTSEQPAGSRDPRSGVSAGEMGNVTSSQSADSARRQTEASANWEQREGSEGVGQAVSEHAGNEIEPRRSSQSPATRARRTTGGEPLPNQMAGRPLRPRVRDTESTRPDHGNGWLDPATNSNRAHNSGTLPHELFETLSDSDQLSDRTSATSERRQVDDSEADVMPTTRRAPAGTALGRPQRTSIVDLTFTSPPEPSTTSTETRRQPRSLKRTTDAALHSRATKRRRRNSTTATAEDEEAEEVDLTDEKPSAKEGLQQRQTAEVLKSQLSTTERNGRLKIGQHSCIICLDGYTNATTSHCGHIFCHECLTRALIASEKNSDRSVGNCPACRKPISRKRANQMVPISFMRKSAFKGKARLA